ncbi:NAD-dependent epimerase/dehydratase [Methanocaldococcus villosus KIN24-T80]|uniref:NAD-dependent epimerase/dehydratase n=1 Tax=Methanocaldococcus villosus KIN24-T80 TaxID=1069083 RepID=N6V0E3_9EURY|nr:NAD-dependent epimerase/dehydratase [Methanocaldococcus villosus]ENN95793.1 NAD-dependent epimerase/dehydratase [Methanocaldococcus villosus KIN24-T80]
MSKTILLTGATGFLGSHLLESLLKENYNVIILKRSFSNTWRIQHLLDNVIYYDIDKVELEKPFKENQIDVVIHTATSYGRKNEKISEIVDTNLMFPLKLLELCTFFNIDTFFNTDTILPKNLNYYVLSKKQFLEYGKRMCDEYNLRFINIKLEHMYGPKDDNTKFIPYIIEKILKNEKEIDLTKGEQERDFIYISDVVSAYITVLNKLDNFEKKFYNIEVGVGNPIKIRDLVILIKKLCNSNIKLNFGAIPYRKNEIMKSYANIDFLKSLGWEPKISIEEGLKKTIDYYKKLMVEKNGK